MNKTINFNVDIDTCRRLLARAKGVSQTALKDLTDEEVILECFKVAVKPYGFSDFKLG